eukprot:jgi/Botrbrau1/14019/Bobra.0310s0006.1
MKTPLFLKKASFSRAKQRPDGKEPTCVGLEVKLNDENVTAPVPQLRPTNGTKLDLEGSEEDGSIEECGTTKSAKKKKKGKKKAKKYVPLPSVEAMQGRLKWQVNFSQSQGRFIVAAKDIAAGELLLRESPCAVVPRMVDRPICHHCLKDIEVVGSMVVRKFHGHSPSTPGYLPAPSADPRPTMSF